MKQEARSGGGGEGNGLMDREMEMKTKTRSGDFRVGLNFEGRKEEEAACFFVY